VAHVSDAVAEPRLIARALLSTAAFGYRAAVAVRRALYGMHVLRACRLPVPVISVGNLTAGGTGKTPFVAWLAAKMQGDGLDPVVLSRGHAAFTAQDGQFVNDEYLVLRDMIPSVKHLQGKNRYRSALQAIEKMKPDLFVLDDGFQHWQLARDLDIVLIDATNPFGNRRLLPRGTLREGLAALRRAHVFVLSRSDLVAVPELNGLKQELLSVHADAVVAQARSRCVRVTDLASEATHTSDSLRGRRVFLAAGIGNPASFRRLVNQLGVEVASAYCFPDHHAYREADVDRLRSMSHRADAQTILVTQKDGVKLRMLSSDLQGFWQLEIETVVDDGEDQLMDAVRRAVADAATS